MSVPDSTVPPLRRAEDLQMAVVLAHLESRLDEQDRALARIERQTTKTNGNVSELQLKENARTALEQLAAKANDSAARHHSQLQAVLLGAAASSLLYWAVHLLG